jgi:Zn finger protein HypA/HybF involved in hydrogenase expression
MFFLDIGFLYLIHKTNILIMELQGYFEKYHNEETCIEDFKNKRLKNGLICKKCSHNIHSFRKVDLKFQCNKCGKRISLRSGTVMENSNLPIKYWMICIELMTLSKRRFSILQIQYLLGHKRYEPIWLMVQKIRFVMQQRDEKYLLKPYSEFDSEFLREMEKFTCSQVKSTLSKINIKNQHKPISN